jgi:hypothetical protein
MRVGRNATCGDLRGRDGPGCGGGVAAWTLRGMEMSSGDCKGGTCAWMRVVAYLSSVLSGERVGGGGDLLAAGFGESRHHLRELGVLQARHQEGPAIGALLLGTDLRPLGLGD